MSDKNDGANNASNACIVCYKPLEYYSIGMCDHPVCYECSTRMRVLCQQNECPICRQDLPKVVFTKEIKPFRFLKKGNLFDSKYNIHFDSPEIQEKFQDLLSHKCYDCDNHPTFNSFNTLKEHMKRRHDLHFCDLCVDNVKIFSHERRCYTRTELMRHRKKGDVDDKSHRGHPLCEFCDKRYMDNDELFRHLRRDHLFCHFCDADGLHHYYCSYNDLREHFRAEHYLCEEGGCADEQFTSVFRTDIDLKAHKASVHGKQLGKYAAKQARTLELEFTLAPRGDLRNRRGPIGPSRNARDDGNFPRDNHRDNHHHHHPHHHHHAEPPEELEEQPTFVQQPLCDVQSTEEFPTLGNSAPCLVPSLGGQVKGRGNLTIRGKLRQGNYNENFPALGPESTATPSASMTSSGNTVSKTLNFSVSAGKQPGVSARQTNATPNLSIHVNHRPNGTVTTRLSGSNLRIKPGTSRDADFPALGGHNFDTASSAPSTSSSQSWTKVTCVKPEVMARAKKVAPPPQLAPSPPPIKSGENFPSLSKSAKSGKNGPQIATPSWVQVQSTNTSSNSSSIITDATKGKAKKKKIKQPQQQLQLNSNGNELSSLASKKPTKNSTLTESKKDTSEPSKKDRSKTKQNSDQYKTNEALDVGSTTSAAAATPVQRKRSELKIDNLNTTNNNLSTEAKTAKSVTRSEDFPALGGSAPSRPPGLTSPPPGFKAPMTTAPPPGFMSQLNGLTFTNSSGESYSIVPEESEQKRLAGNYSYLPPSNFQKRNQNLIAEFKSCFGSEENEELSAFRYLSGMFRSGLCDASEYYKQCRTVMGAEAFARVFPELLALLPDIEKQRELFEVHRCETNNMNGKVKNLDVCANCGQILKSADFQHHASSHTLENHFPALGKSGVTSNSSWPRKS